MVLESDALVGPQERRAVTDLAGLKDSELCKPASMYMTDGGIEPLNTADPLKCVTTQSP
jgi:hypothetical protein